MATSTHCSVVNSMKPRISPLPRILPFQASRTLTVIVWPVSASRSLERTRLTKSTWYEPPPRVCWKVWPHGVAVDNA